MTRPALTAWSLPGISIFTFGLVLGAISWAISPLVSETFEPFDSGVALAIGQVSMALYAGHVGFRYGFWKLALAVTGLYLGQVGYAYLFGTTDTRAWIALGAITTLLLCVPPALSGLLGMAIRRLRQSKAAP